MSAPQEIITLVERFERNREAYTSGQYNETQLRREFLDPFFEALGWDVNNKSGYAEAYKDVIHEDSIKIGGLTKAPDYCFRIGGSRKFFVEAKKPAVNIRDDVSPAFQLRRYAWSARLPLSILTDFEEFAVYDCRVKPDKADKSSTARTMFFTFQDYEKRWEEIDTIFSREAILKGSFDRYAESEKKKKGTAEVDAAFLKEIESWRELLARNIALRNPALSQRELNFAVQQTIDRIIFLRICEDRGIEEYNRLLTTLNGANVYQRLCQLFRRADDKYNSGLFHFTREKEREEPDELTLNLAIDDNPLKEIIRGLYYPDSPYEFSVLPADILGQVYEQFLGKVIRLTDGHRAVIEDKPEVKKAGGVYYTPTYIVDYIVKNTVGKLLEGKTPKQAAKLRILDPACGSGSFLIGAFHHLIDWHRDWYVNDDPQKWAIAKSPALFQAHGGEWRLITSEKRRILLNNIYGVDIDPQAVEVTKLSLLLKVLEGESDETLSKQLKLFQERALPDLGNNIKCGNSLIGPDFYNSPIDKGRHRGVEQQLFSLDDEERYRINAFDWHAEFQKIFPLPLMEEGRGAGVGGFDAVIGNPPYIRIQALKEWAPVEVEFYKQRYSSAGKGNYDIYVVFVERGLSLLNDSGRLGFILPSKFFSTDYGEGLRQIIAANKSLSEIVDFGHTQIFEKATTYTCLLFLTNAASKSIAYVKISTQQELDAYSIPNIKIDINSLTKAPWLFATDKEKIITDKLFIESLSLNDLPARIGRGSSSGADDVFVLKREGKYFTSRYGEQVQIEEDILRIPIYATDFGRFNFNPKSNEVIIFPYNVEENNYNLKTESEMKKDFPEAYSYLTLHKKKLEARKQFNVWYGYSASRNLDVHDSAHMLVPLLAEKGSFCFLPENKNEYCLMASGGFSITINKEAKLSSKYVTGLLNSRLLFWRLRAISNIFRAGWITCTKQYVETLPIKIIDFTNPIDKARHDKMISFVEQMLALNKQFSKAKTAHEKTILQRQIDATDKQIDNLVYELYSLTEEEIKIVEGG
jgi:type I restriction-modification system DNA methylase subunit/predicted type IV restriction endonuclease